MRVVLVVLSAVAAAMAATDGSSPNLAVWWFAPFLSGGGYASEAHDMVQALRLARVKTRITHAGDNINEAFEAGLPAPVQTRLARLAGTRLDIDRTVVVCHTEPGADGAGMLACRARNASVSAHRRLERARGSALQYPAVPAARKRPVHDWAHHV
jgi:hypothetical protein